MSSAPRVILCFATLAGAKSSVIVNATSFEDLIDRAAETLGLDKHVVEIIYDDDEGDPVLIGSQAELDIALLQSDTSHLFCRLVDRTPPLHSGICKQQQQQGLLPEPAVHHVSLYMLAVILLFAGLPVLISFITALIRMPESDPPINCSSLLQQWKTAIEAESINDEFSPSIPIRDLLNVCPHDMAFHWIGRYEYLQGSTYEAMERFRASVKLNPANAASHLWLGRCFAQLEWSVDALKAFSAAAHLAPYLAEAQFEFARALASPEVIISAAFEAVTAAVSADLNFDEARLLKGRLAYEMGDVESAYSEFSILAARHPDSAEYQTWKSRVFDDILLRR